MIETVRDILNSALQLGDRANQLERDSPLLGAIPEFDSMAVVTVLTLVEEQYDIEIEDDDVSAEDFETVGSLADFIERKINT